jgi:hypothetical protein
VSTTATDATHRAPGRHAAFLRPAHPRRDVPIDSWSRSALERGHKLLSISTPTGSPAPSGTSVLSPNDLHPSSAPADLVRAALDEGFTGLSILIRADEVIAVTSADFHAAVESALTALCAEHPARVLCVYDRPGAGTEHLGLAVTHHRGGLQEQLLTIRDAEDRTHVDGEVDVTNLDVFAAALRTRRTLADDIVHLDMSGTAFLSAGAADALVRHVMTPHDGLAAVQLHNPPRHIRRVLGLAGLAIPAEERAPPER